MSNSKISVVVPAYSRSTELIELLDSVISQTAPPLEVVICEDHSPERDAIRSICNDYLPLLDSIGTSLIHIENEVNIGYDKNLRKCIESARGEWALILGNDDLLLPKACEMIENYVKCNNVNFISRSFLRFNTNIDTPIGTSSSSDIDRVFNSNNSAPRMIFRLSGFVGGLVVNTNFARSLSTSRFDGSLFYQIYLASSAFCQEGIGYISSPIVGGRTDNPPMFGHADDDKDFHVPGSYSAKGRAQMWLGVIKITEYVGAIHNIDLVTDVRHELQARQAFHVFEMNAGQSKQKLTELKNALLEINLFSHPFTKFLYYLNYFLGPYSRFFYSTARKIIQN